VFVVGLTGVCALAESAANARSIVKQSQMRAEVFRPPQHTSWAVIVEGFIVCASSFLALAPGFFQIGKASSVDFKNCLLPAANLLARAKTS
jgi:hypothetical protein